MARDLMWSATARWEKIEHGAYFVPVSLARRQKLAQSTARGARGMRASSRTDTDVITCKGGAMMAEAWVCKVRGVAITHLWPWTPPHLACDLHRPFTDTKPQEGISYFVTRKRKRTVALLLSLVAAPLLGKFTRGGC